MEEATKRPYKKRASCKRGPYKKKLRCFRGHLFTEKNTYPHKQAKNGVLYTSRQCRLCVSIRERALYHHSPERREKIRAYSLARRARLANQKNTMEAQV